MPASEHARVTIQVHCQPPTRWASQATTGGATNWPNEEACCIRPTVVDTVEAPGAHRTLSMNRVAGTTPPRYMIDRPQNDATVDLLDQFLERRAAVSSEDQSPSVQRFREMIGRDEKMLIVFEWIRTAAKSDISVLILGPTGSGKEVVARMIHELSRRSVAKSCGRSARRYVKQRMTWVCS